MRGRELRSSSGISAPPRSPSNQASMKTRRRSRNERSNRMRGLVLTIAGLAAASSLAVGLNSASASSNAASAATEGRCRKLRAGPDPRRRARPYPLSVREGQAREEHLHRPVRRLLAAADRIRQTARGRRRESVPARHHQAAGRTTAGHLPPPPALHVRQGQEQGPDER